MLQNKRKGISKGGLAQLANNLVRECKAYIDSQINKTRIYNVQGNWVAAEGIDSNLSIVEIAGLEYRYVRKGAHVTGLTAGDAILMVSGMDVPLTIMAKLVGDITLAAES